MKLRLLYHTIVCAIVCAWLIGCHHPKDTSWPLCGALEAFTTTAADDTLTLTGIRNRITGDT